MHKKKYSILLLLTLIFGFCFIVASCNILESAPEGYILPTAKYQTLDSNHFSVTIEFFGEEDRKEKETQYATIVIHHFSDSLISLADDAIIPFQIKGTNLKGEAQLDILTTINDPEIHSDEIQNLKENEEPMTVVLGDYEEVRLIYRTPEVPSQ